MADIVITYMAMPCKIAAAKTDVPGRVRNAPCFSIVYIIICAITKKDHSTQGLCVPEIKGPYLRRP